MRSTLWSLLLVLIVGLSWAMTRPSEQETTAEIQLETLIDSTDIYVPTIVYGEDEEIDLLKEVLGDVDEGYIVYRDRIRRNEFLSDMLGKCGVAHTTVHHLVNKAKPVFDVRKMNALKPYSIICNDDSLETTHFLIYPHTKTETIVFDLRDSLNVFIHKKSIDTLVREASGVIQSSLYMTLIEQNVSPQLVVELEAIYAWAIDFFRIQKGDQFKVIYEEYYAGNDFIGIGQVKAACFEHFNQPYYAIYFDHPDLVDADYYDEKAKSLRKAFLKAPVKYSRISSRYSGRRFHPVQKRFKAHLGTDYAAPRGTPIYATANGTVSKKGRTRGNGNYIKIKHNSVYSTQYLHMSKFKSGVNKGTRVKQGQVIGFVGSTGLATGPHVCYRFWKNGKQVDPYRQKLPAAEPLKANLIPQYLTHLDSMSCRLDKIAYPSLEVAEPSVDSSVIAPKDSIGQQNVL